jgi:L-ascorbate metabolism protein UlaG (beta-lactamase superfamily)
MPRRRSSEGEEGRAGRPVGITYLGQSTFLFTTPESRRVLVDPWTAGNPLCPTDQRDVHDVDLILVTHAHHDHLGDVFSIAATGSPTVVAVVELGKWLGTRGLRRVQTMNLGGIVELLGVRVAMTPAAHSSSVDDDPFAYVGPAAGFVLAFSNGARIYHAGDTAAFSGMELIHRVHRPQLAMLPIGDHHTMMADEAAVAVDLLQPDRVIPMHYGITPGSDSAPRRFRDALTAIGLGHVETSQLRPGETVDCDGTGRLRRQHADDRDWPDNRAEGLHGCTAGPDHRHRMSDPAGTF